MLHIVGNSRVRVSYTYDSCQVSYDVTRQRREAKAHLHHQVLCNRCCTCENRPAAKAKSYVRRKDERATCMHEAREPAQQEEECSHWRRSPRSRSTPDIHTPSNSAYVRRSCQAPHPNTLDCTGSTAQGAQLSQITNK